MQFFFLQTERGIERIGLLCESDHHLYHYMKMLLIMEKDKAVMVGGGSSSFVPLRW
jgi:hypothetical protein